MVRGVSGSVGASAGHYGAVNGDAEKEDLLNHLVVKQLMDTLGSRERRLIQMRYFQGKTQSQVATVLGISQVQVSRLEKKILLQMRQMINIS